MGKYRDILTEVIMAQGFTFTTANMLIVDVIEEYKKERNKNG